MTGRKFHLFYVKVFKYNVTSNCFFFLCLEFLSRANGCLVPANKWQYPTVTTFAGTVSYPYGQRKFWSWRGEVERKEGRIQRSGNSWSEKDQCSMLAYSTEVQNIWQRSSYPVASRCKFTNTKYSQLRSYIFIPLIFNLLCGYLVWLPSVVPKTISADIFLEKQIYLIKSKTEVLFYTPHHSIGESVKMCVYVRRRAWGGERYCFCFLCPMFVPGEN